MEEKEENVAPEFIMVIDFKDDGSRALSIHLPTSPKLIPEIVYYLEMLKTQFIMPDVIKNLQTMQLKPKIMTASEMKKRYPGINKIKIN